HNGCRSDRMRAGDPVHYNGAVFPVRDHGSDPGSAPWNGAFGGADDPLCDRNSGDEDHLDLRIFPAQPVAVLPFYLVSGLLDRHDPYAGGLLLVRPEEMYTAVKKGCRSLVRQPFLG